MTADLWDVLDELPSRRLAPERWTRIAAILDALMPSISSTSGRAWAAAELQAQTSTRLKRLEDETVPMPEPVRERLHRTVEALGPRPPAGGGR